MGASGNSTAIPEQKKDPLERVPSSKPPFTIDDLKKAIPPHCFRRSLTRSFSYLVSDLIKVYIFYYIATTYFHLLPSPYRYLAWPTYWFVQGCVFTVIWITSHDCGHHSFSDYHWLNDTIGFILHSALLTPYFSWKYSHRLHHSNAGSLMDETYPPMTKSNLRWYFTKYLNNPLVQLLLILVILPVGYPLYLAFNVFGRRYDRFPSHYNPYSPKYTDGERLQIYISDAGVIAAAYVLYRVALTHGLVWFVYIYGVPLLIVNGFLVVFTVLTHTHSSLPCYDSTEWDWLRGSLASVDRDFGVLNKVFHNATKTHVLHHLFSTIPHYHTIEATEAIKPLLGDYYKFDDTPFFKAFLREVFQCIYVEEDKGSENKGVFWYKNKL